MDSNRMRIRVKDLEQLAVDLKEVHDKCNYLKHDLGAIMHWDNIVDTSKNKNKGCLKLIREVNIYAENMIIALKHRIDAMPRFVHDNNVFMSTISTMKAAVDHFCIVADDFVDPAPISTGLDEHALKAYQQKATDKLWEATIAMLEPLKNAGKAVHEMKGELAAMISE